MSYKLRPESCFTKRFCLLFSATALASSLFGCRIETAEQFTGAPVTKAVNWHSGQTLEVDGLNGQIHLEPGSAGEVRVTFKPFTFAGYTDEAKAREDMKNRLSTDLTENDASVGVKTDKNGGGSLGAHLFIYLPPEFDSTINIASKNGTIDVNTVGQARTLFVNNTGAGDCRITGAATVTNTNVRCGFTVRVNDVADTANVVSTGIGDVSVSLQSVSASSQGGTIQAESGEVNLTTPAAGGYSVQATSGSIVNEGTLPALCTVASAGSAGNSKTVTCGTGANYVVSASGNVNLGYRQ
jgi:hypothetical protein